MDTLVNGHSTLLTPNGVLPAMSTQMPKRGSRVKFVTSDMERKRGRIVDTNPYSATVKVDTGSGIEKIPIKAVVSR